MEKEISMDQEHIARVVATDGIKNKTIDLTNPENENAVNPREFWLEPSYVKDFGLGKGIVAYFEEPPMFGMIHVIEYRAVESLTHQLEALKAENEKAREVIGFYADEKTYHQQFTLYDDWVCAIIYTDCEDMDGFSIGGKRAREFLASNHADKKIDEGEK